MYGPGEKVWLKTTTGWLPAIILDPETDSQGRTIYLIEIAGGEPRLLATDEDMRPRDDEADPPVVVRGETCTATR